jgi:hypothetical protein
MSGLIIVVIDAERAVYLQVFSIFIVQQFDDLTPAQLNLAGQI